MLNWRETQSELPEKGQIVILSNERINDFRSWTIGQFLENDETPVYWLLTEIKKTLIPKTYQYWTPLLSKGLGLPVDYKKEELAKYLNAFKEVLKSNEHRFLLMGKTSQLVGGNLYQLDFYFNGIYSRALSLIEGFLVLLSSRNFMAASHLVRPNLDNFLRMFAVWLVKNRHDFAREVLKGTKIDNIKDKDGQFLKDWYLRNKAAEKYPWINEVYKQTSGYIHFSSKHIYNPIIKVDTENSSIGTFLTKYDSESVTDLNRIEAVLVMIEISNCILEYAYGWAITKIK